MNKISLEDTHIHTVNIKLKAESTLLQITFIYTTRIYMYIRCFFHLIFVLIFTSRYLWGSSEAKHD